MKKYLIVLLSAMLVLFLPATNICFATASHNVNLVNDPAVLQNIITRLTLEDVQKAVDDYYSDYTEYLPRVEAYAPISSTKVLEVSYNTNENLYEVIMEVQPYVAAHNVIGQDKITLEINGSGNVKVTKFEHIKSFEYPPWLNQKLKKPFPKNSY